jgi:hypothetical protein
MRTLQADSKVQKGIEMSKTEALAQQKATAQLIFNEEGLGVGDLAKIVKAKADSEGRPPSPWSDRRAFRLSIEGCLERHLESMEREIEAGIVQGKVPCRQYVGMLKIVASMPRDPGATGAAQNRARSLLKKYFSPEGREAVRQRLQAAEEERWKMDLERFRANVAAKGIKVTPEMENEYIAWLRRIEKEQEESRRKAARRAKAVLKRVGW